MKNKEEKQNPLSQSEIIDDYIERLEKKDKKNKHKKQRPSFTRRLRIVLPIFIVLLIAAVGFLLYYFDVINPFDWFKGDSSSEVIEFSSETLTEPDLESEQSAEENSTPKAERPSKLFSVTLTPEEDFSLSATSEEIGTLIDEISTNGFTTIFVDFNSSSSLLTDTEQGKLAFTALSAAAKQKAIAVFAVLDVTKLAGDNFYDLASVQYTKDKLCSMLSLEGVDGVMLSGLEYSGSDADFKNYVSAGTLSGFKNYRQNLLTATVQKLTAEVRKKAPEKLLGLITDGVYATKDVLETGIDGSAEVQLLRDKNADVLLWMNQSLFDIVFVKVETTTVSKTLPFESVIKWWSENTPTHCDIGFILSSDLSLKGEGDWKNPDQLGRQLKTLNEVNRYVFCFNSYSALKNNSTGSTELVYKYLAGRVEDDYVMRELSITSPQKSSFTTYENSVAIIGASDPNFPLILNGKEVERTADGYFSLQLDLKVGKNKFSFEHKGTTKNFEITYRYVVVKSYTPTEALKLNGGDSIMVTALARRGSTVKAVLNGKTFSLEMAEEQAYSDFAEYKGIVTLPEAEEKAVSLGKIKFVGTHNGVTESFSGGKVTINKKPVQSSSQEGELPPNSGGYIAVGNKLIAEVIKYQIETFDGNVVNDLSQPYNNYLPKGTLDYCSENTIYDSSSGNTYRLLGYGKRVYTISKGVENIRTMRGSLPEKNKLSLSKFSYDGSHTTITLKTDWRAPFKLELAPQKYKAATGSERGTITSATFNYVDITFCYAKEFDVVLEEIANSPVFSKAQVIKNTADYTLRLYLKKTGAFYGWTADYNSEGELVFKFLNPKKATKADNEYGGRLDGIKIVIDPGHGGSDPGAVGNHNKLTEAERSLTLSKMLKTRLESLGAKVIMTRTTDKSLTPDERALVVRNNNPDLAVSVHRNAANNSSARGFSAHYFNPYTKLIADKIKDATSKSGTYTKYETKWHVFYMSRISNCPVVLTENGFMSNSNDFANIKDNPWNEKCADAIVKGIVDYFLSIG